MDEVNNKLDLILNKISEIDKRLILLENETKDIHQFVPFVGWLDNISKKILTIPKMAWLKKWNMPLATLSLVPNEIPKMIYPACAIVDHARSLLASSWSKAMKVGMRIVMAPIVAII